MSQEKERIIALLNDIQRAYTERNVSNARSFVERVFLNEKDVLVIGTSAITSESSEWCVGHEEVVTIIEDDWKYWGDLKLDIENAHISFENEVAFIALTGVVYEKIASDDYYNYRLNLIEQKLKETSPLKTKLLEIMQGSADTLGETSKGEDYHWPLRLTLQAINKDGAWKVKQMHFSYPITSYPPVRL